MAADWIKMRSNLATDPDVVALAAALTLDEFAVVGRLQALWAWADQHSEDGTLPRATSAFVDRLTACPGFAEALRCVGWLEGRDSALRLPNWDRHNGNTAKARAIEARRKQSDRTFVRKIQDTCPENPGPEKRREEKSRVERKDRDATGEPAEPPAPLNTPQFVAKWDEWTAFRRRMKHPVLLPESVERQWAKLAEFGLETAIEAIDNSIANGWQGLFPEKVKQGKPTKPKVPFREV